MLESGITLTCPNSTCTSALQVLVPSPLGEGYRCACGQMLEPICGLTAADLDDIDLDSLDI